MSNEPIAPLNPFAGIAPALAGYKDRVLFGDVWKRPGLSARDRSPVTVASRISLDRASENGLTREELVEAITHLAFHAGWPVPNMALPILRRVFEEAAA